MRATRIAVCLILFSGAAFSQQATGSIFGLLSDGLARLVASAPIEAKNVDTGMVYRIESGPTGLYRFVGLPVGTYEITVTITNVESYVQQQKIRVTETSPVRFDVIVPLP